MRAVVLFLMAPLLHAAAQTPDTGMLETLVDQLQNVSEAGHGYSSVFSGMAFLPRDDSARWHTGIVGAAAPKVSEPLRQLVAAGAHAIPVVVRHLDDKRPVKMAPVSGMTWTAWSDEYDFNRRLRKQAPEGVNREFMDDGKHPTEHQICVGDLCFTALGQIVNRTFSATRYQASGGMVVSSPVYSQRLLKAVRQDYHNMTQERHREALIQDFLQPDHEQRRNGAAMRLVYFYPEVFDELALRQLAVPVFDAAAAREFAREVLYPLKSAGQRREKVEAHVRQQGEAAREGLLQQLFDDLDSQIADEEGRMYPPLKEKYDARNVLSQLFNYSPPFTPSERPWIKTWEQHARARFIEALGSAASGSIKAELLRMCRAAKDDDVLGLACLKVLAGSGHDAEIRKALEHPPAGPGKNP